MNTKAMDYLNKLRGRPLTFGRMIESLRKADEISQIALARKVGISRAHLCDIEKGRRTITVERAAQLAKVMGYSVNQFIAMALEEGLRNAGYRMHVHLEAA